jgi:hypothetical protein
LFIQNAHEVSAKQGKRLAKQEQILLNGGLRGPCPLPKGAPPRIWTNSLLKKDNKIAFRKSEQKSIRGGLTGACPRVKEKIEINPQPT